MMIEVAEMNLSDLVEQIALKNEVGFYEEKEKLYYCSPNKMLSKMIDCGEQATEGRPS